MVGDISYGVDRLLRGAGRDQKLEPLHILFMGKFPLDIFKKSLRLRHLSLSGVAAGKISAGGLDHLVPVGSELFKIVPGHGIFKHCRVHGRRDELFTAAGHDGRGQHVIRYAVCKLSDHICRCRRDHDQIRLLCKGYMLYRKLKIPVEGVYKAFIAGQRLEGDRRDELCAVRSHKDMHMHPAFYQHAGKRGSLVRGDAAGDA